ncbi:GNAT family N-acetyltransferase [Brachybacterium saurashtrense]|uniref:GNAT family N-acetyltransferase n=1 Tax=Brachybacterium saurashtrense TaxID=556288 RepID=A0A345YKK2_9MICO|nr:GNAT family N-acetyltransferase [Brachybacterium saurashtrense]AXK44454.1 GNAT family N-acetyltransferase [Brachybacterium saurashtrense]RRR23066.1 GNAT family N-acetyltransferase [Brachybacterium saurashtrense]
MLLTDHVPPRMPDALEGRLTTRVPIEGDVPAIAALLGAEARQHTPDAVTDEETLRSRMVGLKSWARRQVVVVPAEADGSAGRDRAPVGWIALEDRATGRTNVQFVLAPDLPERDALAAALLDWAVEVGGSFARARGVEVTQLDIDIEDRDTDRARLLAASGYEKVRTWLHMRRPVAPEEARSLPAPREGTRVRPVHRHESGLPVSQDVRTVHRMLEESFADHWGSYRESFAEFAQRLIERPEEAGWDQWWVAEILRGDRWLPAGGLVAVPTVATASLGEGTYLEYLGVHRSARGHGIAKALLRTAIADAAERGRAHVDLEVDADSPTGADGLYAAMGWETFERTETWCSSAAMHPSRLLEPPPEG